MGDERSRVGKTYSSIKFLKIMELAVLLLLGFLSCQKFFLELAPKKKCLVPGKGLFVLSL